MAWLPVPRADGVYVTWQELVSASAGARVQVTPGRLKAPTPSLAKSTSPEGADLVPLAEASSTVAVQRLGWPTTTGSAQLTLVVVARWLTVTLTPLTSDDAVWAVEPP